ncbi:hypothetical protein A6A29_22000 [Streptomyces sp. TSRI0281]|nr:hypothetical protein A6A29_22000 [Streptomyces sp. TSRI0281]
MDHEGQPDRSVGQADAGRPVAGGGRPSGVLRTVGADSRMAEALAADELAGIDQFLLELLVRGEGDQRLIGRGVGGSGVPGGGR